MILYNFIIFVSQVDLSRMVLFENAIAGYKVALYYMSWSLASIIRAQKISMGECPVFDPIHNFELNRVSDSTTKLNLEIKRENVIIEI